MTYTPPIRRVDTAKGHHYKDADGRRVPGVTTLIGAGVPKPALINWAANATADYAVNRWDELDALPPAQRLSRLKAARYEERDAAANKGTQIHGYAEKLLAGERVEVPDELIGHVEACAKFLDEYRVKPLHVEFSVVSYKHGYAGTGDLIGELTMPDRSVITGLCDWKSNRSGIFGETALQLAGYEGADVLITADGTEIPMPVVDACFAIHLRGDGYSLVPVTTGHEIFRSFLYAAEVAKFVDVAPDLVGRPMHPPTTSTYRLVREQTS